MNSSSGIQDLLATLVWLAVLILIFRAGLKSRRRSVRLLAFAIGAMLAAVMLWNTAVVLKF
jgi:hypothetical protein